VSLFCDVAFLFLFTVVRKEFPAGGRWLISLSSFLCGIAVIFTWKYVLRLVLCVRVCLAVGTAVCFEGAGVGFWVVDRVCRGKGVGWMGIFIAVWS
jgi:hypothetical protein